MRDPVLKSNSQKSYFSIRDNTEAYNITAKDSTIAVWINGIDRTQVETNKLMRVVFLQQSGSAEEKSYIPSINCTDFFADEIDEGNKAFFEVAFEYGQWICPDTTQINVMNDNYLLRAKILSCHEAVDQSTSQAYTDEICESYDQTQDSFNDAQYLINSKQITKYFNPDTFLANNTLYYMSQDYIPQQLTDNSIEIYQSIKVNQEKISVYDDFFFSSQAKLLDVYTYERGQSLSQNRDTDYQPYYTIQLTQGDEKHKTVWDQDHFFAYLSNIGGLFTSILAGARFLISGYQEFVSQKSMLMRLYGEEDFSQARREAATTEFDEKQPTKPKEILQAKIEKRQDFNASYCFFTIVSFFKLCCCCFKSCCCKGRCRRHMDSHRKFQIAQERLDNEQDIQHLIEMNRVTRLLHKVRFQERHKRILCYSHRYVISSEDISQKEYSATLADSSTAEKKSAAEAEMASVIDDLLQDFDNVEDINQTNRQIYFEVTGKQLVEDEFSGTSDEEDWARLSGLNPISRILAMNVDSGGRERKTFNGGSERRPLMGNDGR